MKKFNITTIATVTILLAGTMLPAMAMSQEPAATQEIAATQETASLTPVTQEKLDFQKAKTLLADMLNRLQTHFENCKTKAATLQTLSEAANGDVAQTLQNFIAQVQSLKIQAQNAQTAAQIKAVAQQVRTLILEAKTQVKKNIGQRVEVRINMFTQKADRGDVLFNMAQRRINMMKAQGSDAQTVQTMDENLQNCQRLLETGKENLQEARDKFHSMQELSNDQDDEGSQLMKDGMTMVRTARATYTQARQDCTKVMKELRVLN